jgi:hypothetical protein
MLVVLMRLLAEYHTCMCQTASVIPITIDVASIWGVIRVNRSDDKIYSQGGKPMEHHERMDRVIR